MGKYLISVNANTAYEEKAHIYIFTRIGSKLTTSTQNRKKCYLLLKALCRTSSVFSASQKGKQNLVT